MGQRLVVSEFPNDNPELHDGLVWAPPTPCAPALPTLRLRPSAPAKVLRPNWEPASAPRASEAPLAAPPEPSLIAPEASRLFSEEPLPVEPSAPAAPWHEAAPLHEETPSHEEVTESGFDSFVAALSATLAERGNTRAAGSIGALFGRARLSRDAFDAETKKTLVSRGILDAKTSRPTPEFSVVANAWRDVLDGTSADLAGCGDKTLDVFGAELLAALVGVPRDRSDELRRALRQRGVAAFGMLAAA
ncbi:MAG TPA: hypothetical protein VF103_04355 [Polyangiaceae bacterium]